MGSASETEYHLLVAKDLGFLPPSDHERMAASVQEVKKMLSGVIRKLRADR